MKGLGLENIGVTQPQQAVHMKNIDWLGEVMLGLFYTAVETNSRCVKAENSRFWILSKIY